MSIGLADMMQTNRGEWTARTHYYGLIELYHDLSEHFLNNRSRQRVHEQGEKRGNEEHNATAQQLPFQSVPHAQFEELQWTHEPGERCFRPPASLNMK